MVEEIVELMAKRGNAFGKADLRKMNAMLVELPLEEVSEVRAWLMSSLYLRINEPDYEGDLGPEDL